MVFINLISWLTTATTATAQGVYSRWDFGSEAALHFGPDSVRALTDSRIQAPEACATACDEQGNLQFYGNAEQLWNRQHQPLLNGQNLGGNSSAAQGCLIAAKPGQPGRYYVFTLDAYENRLANRLLMAEVDMVGAGGLGQVLSKQVPVLPDSILRRFNTQNLAEEMTLVRHANGRDYWLVTHLYYSNAFVSVLLSAGITPGSRCVVSAVGRQIGFPASYPYAGGGTLTATRTGRRIAYTWSVSGTELFDFDNATGHLSNPIQLEVPSSATRPNLGPYHYGAAFSADDRLLYTSFVLPYNDPLVDNVFVVQYFLTPVVTSVAQSGLVVYRSPQRPTPAVSRFVRGLQRGPDGLIYASVVGSNRLDVIQAPTMRGPMCQYTVGARPLAGREAQQNLPAMPNDVFQPTLRLASASCGGLARQFQVSGTALGIVGDTLRWTFGDGAIEQTTQSSLTHVYRPGTYTVTVQVIGRGRPQATATLRVTAEPGLQISLGPDTSLCVRSDVRLTAGAQPPGTTYRWQDGSTAAEYRATSPGTYWLELRTPAGCTARDTITITGEPCRYTIPNVITPNGDQRNDYFVLKGMKTAEWRLRVYNRWGRSVYQAEHYANDWQADDQPAGVYYYELTNSVTGQRFKGTMEVIR
ncbi:hypothetical protein GCM10023186_34510 [Hymenobacter koreensis]|uniref:PKD domain-containing protein n=2 Tax=Hymenobacter koreensis TaxID=1084523 RepID=A0ABP8JBH0_9BACT